MGTSSLNSRHGSRGGLQQLPSNTSDFQSGDPTTLQLVFAHASKSFGQWEIKGLVKNTGNDSISFLTVIATIYDSNMKIIDTEQGYATVSGSDNTIDPGVSKPFDIFFSADQLGATPAFFKLGYNWQ